MTINSILDTITSINGATMARANKTNFVVIPTEDGGYVKVTVTTALAKDTKAHKAFNYDAAVAEYTLWQTQNALKEAEKANKPAKTAKGPNPEAQARRDALDKAITDLPSFENYTATDIQSALGDFGKTHTVMAVGSAARRLVNSGVLTMETVDDRARYTKA